MTGFAKGPDNTNWKRRLGALGITPDRPVLVYDDAMFKDSARIWWILRYWGIRDARLLNGGWKAWKAANGTVTSAVPATEAASVTLSPEPDRLVTKEQLLAALAGKRYQILDARSSQEYCGDKGTAKRNGAIPGAIHQEWVEAIDPKTGRFKSPQDLARILQKNGVDLARPTVTYCQSGGRASVLAFTAELMGMKDVRNYYRSWAEWGNAEDTPIEKPAKKK
jgi:thiosulfate/3-mercaptopyruvate sulfurtransferase